MNRGPVIRPCPQGHIVVHARPPAIQSGPAIEWNGRPCATLLPGPDQLARPFTVTFEEACARLERLPRMFIEPDGSFVWTGLGTGLDDQRPHEASAAASETAGQIDGLLSDRQGRLLSLELKGTFSPRALDALLAAVGWPETPVMFQLMREGVFLDEAEFRRCVRGG